MQNTTERSTTNKTKDQVPKTKKTRDSYNCSREPQRNKAPPAQDNQRTGHKRSKWERTEEMDNKAEDEELGDSGDSKSDSNGESCRTSDGSERRSETAKEEAKSLSIHERTNDGNQKKEGDLEKEDHNSPVIVEELVEAGLVGSASSKDSEVGSEGRQAVRLAEATVILDQSPSDTPNYEVHLWESLPKATPIFDAEVVVWDYEPPSYRRRLGYGLFGRRDNDEANCPSQPRDPLFTEEEWSNPFRCVGKVIGVIVALPVWAVYFLLCRVDVWGNALCHALDWLMFRPIGRMLDWIHYVLSWFFWLSFRYLVVPCYRILVYGTRAARNGCLCSTKYALLMPLECIYRSLVHPVTTFTYKRAVQPLGTCIRAVFTLLCDKVLVPCGKGIKAALLAVGKTAARVITALYTSFIAPCGKGISRVLQAIWNAVGSALKLLCYTILWKHMVVPSFKGFMSGVQWTYRNLLKPICKFIYKFVVRPVVSGTKALHKYILVPIGQAIRAVLRFVVKTFEAFHEHVLVPIGKAVSAVFRFIGAVFQSMSQFFGSIARSMGC